MVIVGLLLCKKYVQSIITKLVNNTGGASRLLQERTYSNLDMIGVISLTLEHLFSYFNIDISEVIHMFVHCLFLSTTFVFLRTCLLLKTIKAVEILFFTVSWIHKGFSALQMSFACTFGFAELQLILW